MGRIYALARKVRVWLGPATDQEIDAVSPFFCQSGSVFDDVRQFMNRKYRESSIGATNPSSMLMEKFFSRAWFTRRWVLQEVAVARVVIIHCGRYKVPWAQFDRSASALLWIYEKEWYEYDISRHDSLTIRTLESIKALHSTSHRTVYHLKTASTVESVAYMRILNHIKTYHTADCVDERDRLYALYGLSLGTRPYDETETQLITSCPVDYDIHFSGVYTNFASAAIEAGQFLEIIEHVIEFGCLNNQKGNWPSWVPSWNLSRKMQNTDYCFRLTRPSLHPPEHGTKQFLQSTVSEERWTENSICLVDAHGLRALRLRGCVHHIVETQSSIFHLDALSYFETVAKDGRVRLDSAMSNYMIAWVVSSAIDIVPHVFSRSKFDVGTVFSRAPYSSESSDSNGLQQFLLAATKRVLGLKSDEQLEVNMDKFVSETTRMLESLEAFCYEHNGSRAFGIAFAQVKPGDFVFRTPGAVSAKIYKSNDYSPSAFGLIIRPYHSQGCAGPATFRLVGMCLDYYPHNQDPEIIEIVLV
jgi:hypothetical protein